MKNLILMFVVILSSTLFYSCKKKDVAPNVTNYVVTNFVSNVPFYSVIIHNDTLTCDGHNLIYEYKRISATKFINSRIYWKNLLQWSNWNDTIWNDNKFSYFSGDTLYINK